MSDKEPTNSIAGRNTGKRVGLALLVIGLLLYAFVGLWLISRPQRTDSAAAVAVTPRSTQPPTATTMLPTWTPVPTLVVPSPTPEPPDDGLFRLTIVHSNDTWGYTLPCG